MNTQKQSLPPLPVFTNSLSYFPKAAVNQWAVDKGMKPSYMVCPCLRSNKKKMFAVKKVRSLKCIIYNIYTSNTYMHIYWNKHSLSHAETCSDKSVTYFTNRGLYTTTFSNKLLTMKDMPWQKPTSGHCLLLKCKYLVHVHYK